MPLKGVNLLLQSKRSSLTCTYKCGNACAGECTNESNNPYFSDIMSRRGVLMAFGTGTWIPLLTAHADGTAESHVDGFTGEEVAIYTRLAADEAGATKMDRPEDFEVNPVNGKLYVALTNNKYRGATGENAEKSQEDVTEYARDPRE